MSESAAENGRSRRSGRSPNYPSISLDVAISRARTLLDKEGRNAASMTIITGHWGYSSPSTGPASTTYSALIKFGLLEDSGSGKDRKGKLSDLGYRVLRAPESDRAEAIREAALRPPIHQELWEQFRIDLPSKENLVWMLETERNFSHAGAVDFEKEYRATIAFAGLFEEVGGDADEETAVAESDVPIDLNTVKPSIATVENSVAAMPVSKGVTRIPILLSGGQVVIVEGVFPITDGAWENLKAVLEAMKPGLVADPTGDK
jgi:hypothetical protein